MNDIHGNPIRVGDYVYALTTPHGGAKYKRLFWSKVENITGNKCTVYCYETKRSVSLTKVSVIKPLET